MVKPIVERNKKRTKVVYNKKKEKDTKILIASIVGVCVLGLSLGLGLGFGLKKTDKDYVDPYPPIIAKEDQKNYPIRLISEAWDQEAKELLYELYGREDIIDHTYIIYDKNWGSVFRSKLEGAKFLIIFSVVGWSANKEVNYQPEKGDKPYFYHTRKFNKIINYNLISYKYKDLTGG